MPGGLSRLWEGDIDSQALVVQPGYRAGTLKIIEQADFLNIFWKHSSTKSKNSLQTIGHHAYQKPGDALLPFSMISKPSTKQLTMTTTSSKRTQITLYIVRIQSYIHEYALGRFVSGKKIGIDNVLAADICTCSPQREQLNAYFREA
jgi:hypothetical protein